MNFLNEFRFIGFKILSNFASRIQGNKCLNIGSIFLKYYMGRLFSIQGKCLESA